MPVGGFTDQYIFRLAETYLNRAEAYWWLGKNDLATADVNTIRRRVNAPEFSSVTLEDILDVIGETVEVIDVMKPIYNFKASNEDAPWMKKKEEADGTDDCQKTP